VFPRARSLSGSFSALMGSYQPGRQVNPKRSRRSSKHLVRNLLCGIPLRDSLGGCASNARIGVGAVIRGFVQFCARILFQEPAPDSVEVLWHLERIQTRKRSIERVRAAQVLDTAVDEQSSEDDIVSDVYRRIGNEVGKQVREITVSRHIVLTTFQLCAVCHLELRKKAAEAFPKGNDTRGTGRHTRASAHCQVRRRLRSALAEGSS
jgi:hypothetical protein